MKAQILGSRTRVFTPEKSWSSWFSQLILISFHLLSNVLSSPVQEPNTSNSAVSSVMKNDTMLKVLLERLGIDLNLRQLSKTFRKSLWRIMQWETFITGPAYEIFDSGRQCAGKFKPSDLFYLKVSLFWSCTLPTWLPFTLSSKKILMRKPSYTNSWKFIQESLMVLRNQQRKIDFERFMSMFQKDTNDDLPPMILFYLYNLLRVTFTENSIVTDFINSTGFPLDTLIKYAVSGRLPVFTELKSCLVSISTLSLYYFSRPLIPRFQN